MRHHYNSALFFVKCFYLFVCFGIDYTRVRMCVCVCVGVMVRCDEPTSNRTHTHTHTHTNHNNKSNQTCCHCMLSARREHANAMKEPIFGSTFRNDLLSGWWWCDHCKIRTVMKCAAQWIRRRLWSRNCTSEMIHVLVLVKLAEFNSKQIAHKSWTANICMNCDQL